MSANSPQHSSVFNMTQPLFIALALAIVLVLWHLAGRLLFRTAIDNVPGPKPGSFFYGKKRACIQLETTLKPPIC